MYAQLLYLKHVCKTRQTSANSTFLQKAEKKNPLHEKLYGLLENHTLDS